MEVFRLAGRNRLYKVNVVIDREEFSLMNDRLKLRAEVNGTTGTKIFQTVSIIERPFGEEQVHVMLVKMFETLNKPSNLSLARELTPTVTPTVITANGPLSTLANRIRNPINPRHPMHTWNEDYIGATASQIIMDEVNNANARETINGYYEDAMRYAMQSNNAVWTEGGVIQVPENPDGNPVL